VSKVWADKGGMLGAVAPMFKSVDGKSVSVAAALALLVAPAWASRPAGEHAYLTIVDEMRDKLRRKAERAVARQSKR